MKNQGIEKWNTLSNDLLQLGFELRQSDAWNHFPNKQRRCLSYTPELIAWATVKSWEPNFEYFVTTFSFISTLSSS